MKAFEANISQEVADFLNENLKTTSSCEAANEKMLGAFGIISFFDNEEELQALKEAISCNSSGVQEPDRAEYGDFQTNANLANQVALYIAKKEKSPKIVIEPTCGKGNFIIAALANFQSIETIIGIEIYKPYIWEAKFNIVNYFLKNPQSNKPEISIIHSSVFDVDFKKIATQYATKEILLIGNPPWVTNSKLGSLNSQNLPKKTNFKNHSGLDSMTGKGNFDIAEFITLMLLRTFQKMKGNLLLLVKNAVIKNIVLDQPNNKFQISSLEKYCIDSKKEFNVSVEAALFYCELNSSPTYHCEEFDFYTNQKTKQNFGWLKNKFVSNIDTYIHTKEIDGICPFVWRQGLKHDNSSLMELNKVNNLYVNGLNEEIELEEDLVYGLLKSSDLKGGLVNQTRKFTIVTQKKVGQETQYIKSDYPKTYQYLIGHLDAFNARKSSIYNNKPLFSIFGIGDYSFKPYKVAISGLYKTFQFTLILPQDNKPIMLDDTCYLLGFEKMEDAVYAFILLNSELAHQFLKSITFSDAKRVFTKDVLMRIDLLELAKKVTKKYLNTELEKLNKAHQLNLNTNSWDSFVAEMSAQLGNGQVKLFV